MADGHASLKRKRRAIDMYDTICVDGGVINEKIIS